MRVEKYTVRAVAQTEMMREFFRPTQGLNISLLVRIWKLRFRLLPNTKEMGLDWMLGVSRVALTSMMMKGNRLRQARKIHRM